MKYREIVVTSVIYNPCFVRGRRAKLTQIQELPDGDGTHKESQSDLRHQLTTGQMAMVAVGGSIGTGLLLGSGAAVRVAGPAVIITYIIGAFLAWTVANALGELSREHPSEGSFGVYAELYLSPWAGFVARYAYWSSITAAIGAELVAVATYSNYWFPRVPAMAWIVLYAVLLAVINLRSVSDFGRFEFAVSLVKVVTILAFIAIGAAILLTGRSAPQYFAHEGFFPKGGVGPIKAISFALFSFLGIEMVAITSGEARDAKDLTRATRMAFALLAFVYIGATTVLVGVLPWDQAGVSQSPFVSVFEFAHVPGAAALMNIVVLSAALTSANANLYVTSRMLFSLAKSRQAPHFLAKLNSSGAPARALSLSLVGVLLAMVVEAGWPDTAFLYILGASLCGGMIAWLVSLAAHINYRRRIAAGLLPEPAATTRGGRVWSAIGFCGICGALVSTWWVPQTRVTIVSGLPYLALLSVAYLLMRRYSPRNTI